MNCIRKIILVFIATLWYFATAYTGITDSIHSIPEIQIKADRLEQYLIGSSVQQIDSQTLQNYQSQSLAELLACQSLISVKTYGPGGVAGISLRGGGSHHASVIWNGINIQSPMLGELNFSTLPVSFIDKAYIQYGGSTTLFGSGTATGGIHMLDVLYLDGGLQADISTYTGINHPYSESSRIGISNNVHSAKISYSKKRWASSLKFFIQNNKNDFEYCNIEKTNGPYEKQEHASYSQFGISQSNKIILTGKSMIGTDLWLLQHHSEVPSLMSNYEPGISNQKDRNMMYSMYYKYFGTRLKVKIQTGGFYNQILYEDSLLNPPVTDNKSFSIVNIGEFSYDLLTSLKLGFILEYKNERGLSEYYDGWKTRNIISPVFSILYKNQLLTIVANVRKENVDGNFIPLVYSFGLDLKLFSELHLKGSLSKNYTLPTFNNLYWEYDGFSEGNPDLLPETGWSYETGIYHTLKRNNFFFNTSAVLFQNNISNWIQWLADSGDVWKPQNIMEGVTKGIELDACATTKFSQIKIALKGRYGYTLAEVLKSSEESIQPGRQMFYIPKHQGYGSMIITYKNFLVEYTQNFAGKRNFDHAGGTLDAYTIGNLIQQYTIPIQKRIKIVAFAKINNLWNTQYQIKHSYATPLRQYIFGIKFLFNQ